MILPLKITPTAAAGGGSQIAPHSTVGTAGTAQELLAMVQTETK